MIDLPPSIAAYAPQAEAILDWAKDDWLDQDEFDRRADAWSPPTGKSMAMWFRPESILLPSIMHGGQRDDFIAIAQALMVANLLRARKRRGLVEYRTQPPLSVAA